MPDKVHTIKLVASDLVSQFLYYDRKEDEDLPRGEIERSIMNGEISIQEIVDIFDSELRKGIGDIEPPKVRLRNEMLDLLNEL